MADETIADFDIEDVEDVDEDADEEDQTEDLSLLTPLSHVVISKQATINIGTIGHVAHGKSTVVKSISGVKTVKYKSELERNITIKLGYANAKIYKCKSDTCEAPGCYKSHGSSTGDSPPCEVAGCGGTMQLVRHVSFVDCPGHDILMATMLTGAAVMDAALLLVAGNESCPQPQTSEHLAAVEIMKLQHLVILQNKIDLVPENAALKQHDEIKKFVKGTVAERAPIIPISAQLKYNIDVLCEYLHRRVPIPVRDFSAPPRLIVIRSFDINKPGSETDQLRGGVAGGSIVQGVLKRGDQIEIRPGIVTNDGDSVRCTPIMSRIETLFAEQNLLKFAVPGGLIGVGTLVDPVLCRQDRLVGQILGQPGTLPDVFVELEISFYLLRRLIGLKSDGGSKNTRVSRLQTKEVLMVNIGSTSSGCRVIGLSKDIAKIVLLKPVCAVIGEKIALSRRVDKHFRLIGWGNIMTGVPIKIK